MDVQGDIILIASQFGWEDAVHCDVILPMSLVVHCDFPESKSNLYKLIFSLIYIIIFIFYIID